MGNTVVIASVVNCRARFMINLLKWTIENIDGE